MRRSGSALAVLLVSGAATAAPLASIREDVDGNGTPDVIELGADGIVQIGATARVKVASSVTKARIAVARSSHGAQVVVDVTSGATREGVVLERAGRTWQVATRFALGGVGLDREYGFEVDATPTGVIRYQTRWDVRRCDDKPAYLFAERLEGTTFRKLDKIPTQIPDSAATLAVRLDTTPAAAPLIYQAKAASHQAGVSDAGGLAIPRELDDGRIDTGWREELLASHGEGQFFTFKPRVDTARAYQLRIVPGNPTSQAAMKAASRPRTMAIVAGRGAWRFEVPDGTSEAPGSAYVVDLPQIADCITVVLESSHGRGPTAIAELGIYAKDERTGGGEALLAKVIAEGKSGATNAAAALARRGGAGARAIDTELATTTDAGVRRRLIGALVKIQDPAAAASLVRAATEGWVRDKDLIDVIGALATNGQIAVLRDLAAKGGLPLEIRIAAAERITPAGAGFTALVDLAGRGPRELRHAVIERLASAQLDQLLQSATTHSVAPAAGDLWRAVTRGVRSDPSRRADVVAAMAAALAVATDYERQYRLIDGIASHGDAAALAKLDALLRALPAGTHASALRQVAIRGIESSPRVQAAPIVLAFARDPDPGVRLAAVSAIANAETDAAGVWHAAGGHDAIDRVIITAMADGWPEIRRRAANALGVRCQRPGPARALFEAVGKDRDLDVRIDSLTALVQCHATGIRDLLAQTWDSSKQPLQLREHAIGQVVALGDKQLATTLVGKFTRWRGQAIESKEAMVLAQRAAATIGQLNPPGAAQALMAALDDSAFPEIVSAAALGLGALGPACPAAAKAKLTLISRSDDQSAVAAKRAAAQCGR
jgi:hypothetical protein